MKKNRFNRYFGVLTLGVALLATPGCTDTWDEHYGSGADNGGASVTSTLWDQIVSNENLSKFAAIAQKAQYYKDNVHPVEGYTFADMLKSNQIVTVWAPNDDAISDQEFQKWMELCETSGYDVQLQFFGNHIAVWRNPAIGEDVDTIRMINSKRLEFNKQKRTLQGVPMVMDMSNVAASNGILHVLDGQTPFNYNFYEFVKFGNQLKDFRTYLVSRDTTYFSADASIEGLPDENGNPTYVDSVYMTTNRMMRYSYLPDNGADRWMIAEKGFAANIGAEDSSFIMLMPTDAALAAAKTKLSPYYKYADSYEDRVFMNINTRANEYRDDYKADSLSEASVMMDILTPTVFNLHTQGKIGGNINGRPWNMDEFIDTKGDAAEFFVNMRGDTLRNTVNWDKTTLFNGNVVDISNGKAFLYDNWNYPIEFYKPDVYIETTMSQMYRYQTSQYWQGRGEERPFSSNTFKDIVELYGKPSRNSFTRIEHNGRAICEVMLQGNTDECYTPYAQVMSGKYDIYLVVVPNWYNALSDRGSLDSLYLDSAYVDSISQLNKFKFKAQVRYNDGSKKDRLESSNDVYEYDGKKVDTILIKKDFVFPYSYANLRYCYPSLLLTSQVNNNDTKNGYAYPMNIDRIIMVSKEDGHELNVVAP